jgi:hypothetical protein
MWKNKKLRPNFEEVVEYRTVLANSLAFIHEKCLMYLGEKLGV